MMSYAAEIVWSLGFANLTFRVERSDDRKYVCVCRLGGEKIFILSFSGKNYISRVRAGSERVRYCSSHSNIKFVSSLAPPCSFLFVTWTINILGRD